jgi:hypothetical protein
MSRASARAVLYCHVEYPTPQAFIDMVTTPEYSEVHEHRAAGLERGDLVATSAWSLASDAQ